MKQINSRTYLEQSEVESLFQYVKENCGKRVWLPLVVSLTYKHALRLNEAIGLKKAHFNLENKEIYCFRLKKGLGLTHQITEGEIFEYRAYLNAMVETYGPEWEKAYKEHELLIVTDRMLPFDYRHTEKILSEAGMALFGKKVTMHALRHSCAYHLLQKNVNLFLIKEYLGHREIGNTCLYLPAVDKQLHEISSIFENINHEEEEDVCLN